jgi:methylenetetrahydrofolate dehydrogenase (NADP+)/methenyltetrahydrofolate cyclohydrolase/formyltetrahydrofolate synthetase
MRDELAAEVTALKRAHAGFQPTLAIVQLGTRRDSSAYVNAKMKATEECGLKTRKVHLDETTTQEQLEKELHRLNEDPSVHGIIVQMPLPKHIDSKVIVDLVDWKKDVDGFHVRNIGELAKRSGDPLFVPCTAAGVMKLLESANVNPKGKHAVVMGRSDIVGMPVFQLLQKAGATVTLCHTQTVDVESFTSKADILVVAAGQPQYVGAKHIKQGAVVIDVGIHSVPGSKHLVGDVKFDEVAKVASAITPVPGGVGPMTVALLMRNTVDAAKRTLRARPMSYIKIEPADPVPSDEVISRLVQPKSVALLAEEIGVLPSELILYGPHKAKVSLSILDRLRDAPKGKLVVVTGVNPTQFGEGKTTTLLGLVQALNVRCGKLAFGTLRQPSQGPTFGIK